METEGDRIERVTCEVDKRGIARCATCGHESTAFEYPQLWRLEKTSKGTELLCGRDGVVVDVVDYFRSGGKKEKYKQRANFIVIRHADGTYARYFHIAYRSSQVKRGQIVTQGQVIAKCGSTGFSFGPHLHFDVVDCHSKETSTLRVVGAPDINLELDSCFATFSLEMGLEDRVQGRLVLAEPMEIPLDGVNNVEVLRGSVVLCKRGGDSTFIEKTLIAQKAGAKALLIMNSDRDLNDVLPLMGGVLDGPEELTIDIPVLTVSYRTGKTLKKAIERASKADTSLEGLVGVSPHLAFKKLHPVENVPFCKPYTLPVVFEPSVLAQLSGTSGQKAEARMNE